MLPGTASSRVRTTGAVEEPVIESLHERACSSTSGRSSTASDLLWRCKTPLVFRVVDDWFISADGIRQPMLDANATVEWTPSLLLEAMDDWLRTWATEHLAQAVFRLPLPFYPCSCGHLNVIGSRAELEERATRPRRLQS